MIVSIEDYFKCPVTIKRLYNCGYLSSYLDNFLTWMAEQHFSHATITRHISNVAHLGYSLKDTQSDIQNLNSQIYEFLNEHIPVCSCKGWKQPTRIKQISFSLNCFKKHLTRCHGMNFNSKDCAYSQIHNAYLSWLSDYKNLAKSTIRLRSSYLNQFLEWYKKTSPHKDLRHLMPCDIEVFYITATERWGAAYKRSLQGTLRTFFDFCHEQEYTTQNLRFSLPVIRSYRLSKAPKYIKEKEAIKLLGNIDRSTGAGKRAYAALRLLYAYGIRGCQLRLLKFNDIDWHKEEIHFPPVKDGKKCSFPLTEEVGNALLDYLQNARHKSPLHHEVFLISRAPYIPLTSRTLAALIHSEMMKAGVESPTKGAHCFRHGFVSKMLNQGESFKHIADLLGHKHIETTFIYTKIDFNSLACQRRRQNVSFLAV